MQYRRMRTKGGTYFFTVNLEYRHQTLLTDHIHELRSSFKIVKQKHPFMINAIVILPDHLHCIWTLPKDDDNYSLRWKLIKERFSKQLVHTFNSPFENPEPRSYSRIKKQERGIWQRRFWEHQIRDDHDLTQHIHYIHNNPVKHGYCTTPADWPYSSYITL